jgi:hypothetical protein
LPCNSGDAGNGPNGGDAPDADAGAGGGGYFGGGAGASGGDPAIAFDVFETGGGGGSDYPDPTNPPARIRKVSLSDGVKSGNGLVTITYSLENNQGQDNNNQGQNNHK